ncbi:hypothetical protein WN55_08909 [Dufourea novaeangliae]|uniref:Uncharacterized protein n=1 Tax=Dufourea novaeangliae TaxID=178035 RepID=A0A154P505_DUFNO|nr:hypothetical protein WN55_08909 [Dufourea novaeangliae]
MDFNLPELTANETSQNDHSNLVNVTQSYLLLKKRICDTHEVIQQYNDKLKECEHLKTDLDATNKQAKKVACNYNSMLAKVIKLELQNTEYKKNIESLTTQVNDRQVKAAADQQHIQQLICKIKDVESQHNDKVMQYDLKKSSLEVRVKELEQELKNVKKSYDLKTKKMEEKKKVENKTPTKNKVKMKDVGSITTLTMDEIVQKQKVSDKCVMTDEFYNVKDNMYPIFCAKCEVLLEPTPLEKICEIMTESCPKLIEKISSPLKKVTLPPLISPGMNNERCKTENVTVLPETQPSHLQNRTVDPHFIPTNPLASHEQMTLSRTDYCNNFPQTSSLMNQNSYCIGSTPVNPLSLANMSTTSQNNHCDEASTLASSLLLISSLQKRIDTLEMKVKKKFNKKNSEQNSNLWQRTHQNPCCMHDINNISVQSKDISRVETTNLECNNRSKTSTCSAQSTDTDELETVDRVRNSVESRKSLGGETDSGILSDSVESNKLIQLEGDLDSCIVSTDCKHARDEKSSMENTQAFTGSFRILRSQSKEKSPIKLIKTSRLTEEVVDSKVLKPNEQIEEIDLNDLQEIENCESHVSYSLQGEKHFEKEVEDIKDDDYVPKKKPRIAHVPKKIPDRYSIDIDESVVTQTMVKGDSNVGSENKCSNRTNELKPNSSNSMHSNTTNVPENNNINEMSTIDIKPFSHSPDNDLENKNLSMVDMNSSRDSTNLTMSSLDDSFEGLMEFDELKTEATNEYKQIKQEYQNNSPHSKNAILEADNNTNKFDDESSKNGTDQSSKLSTLNAVLSNNLNPLPYQDNDNSSRNGSTTENDVYVCKRNVQEVVRNQSCDVNGSLVSSEDIHLMNVQDNDTNKITKVYATKLNSNAGSKLESQSLLARIRQFASTNKSSTTNCNNQSMNLLRISLITDKFVNKQLQRLVDCDWKVCAVHWDVIDKLKTTCTPCVIAKGIVDFFSSEEQSNKSLDNSHTPPAPLMTQTQQRIAALLIDLEKSNPMIFQLVQTGIEYKLFRLNQQIERSVVESLARMYTILARIKKDRGKVRIFCCDALYCLGVNAILVLYTVFTCWPETFPNNETNKELLPECMAHLIMTQQAVDYPKLKALKNLVSLFYKYPTGTISKDMLNKLLSALQEKSDAEIEAAIILLAKREGTAWTYKNIIRGALLPMIINNKLPSAYRSFCLLGNLMRVFPVGDKNNSVGEIVEQLCDLINSGEVSEEQQEGIISALLSLSRHKFDDVVQNVIKWTPTAPLHDRTTEQINGLLNQRPPDFWKGYLRTNKLFVKTSTT